VRQSELPWLLPAWRPGPSAEKALAGYRKPDGCDHDETDENGGRPKVLRPSGQFMLFVAYSIDNSFDG